MSAHDTLKWGFHSQGNMTSTIQSLFPPLPQHNLGGWPADIHAAHEVIRKAYDHATCVLQSDGFPDPTQVAFHINALSSNALPILEALIPSSASDEDEHLPLEWIVGVAELLGQAVQDLQAMAHIVNTLSVQFSVREEC